MTTKTNIVRAPRGKDRPYFATNRATAQDRKLSFEARGLLWYLLSKPDNWKLNRVDLQREGGIGRDKVKRLIEELQAHGYIVMERQQSDDGRFAWVYQVYEVPCTENKYMVKETPSTEKPSTVEPSTVNPRTYKEKSIQSTEPQKDHSGKPESATLEHPKPPRQRSAAQLRLDGMVDALVVVFGLNPDTITRAKWSELRGAGKQLLEANATPADIPALHKHCVDKRWADFSSMAMAKEWPVFVSKRQRNATPATAGPTAAMLAMREAQAVRNG